MGQLMNLDELKRELNRLRRHKKEKYSELIQAAQKRFKWAREACDLTQEKLADKLFVERGTIVKSESMGRGDLESGGVKTFISNYLIVFDVRIYPGFYTKNNIVIPSPIKFIPRYAVFSIV